MSHSPGEGDESTLPLKPSARLAVVNHAKTDPAMMMHPCRTHPAPRSWFITGPAGVTGHLCPFHFCDLRPKQAGAREAAQEESGTGRVQCRQSSGPRLHSATMSRVVHRFLCLSPSCPSALPTARSGCLRLQMLATLVRRMLQTKNHSATRPHTHSHTDAR